MHSAEQPQREQLRSFDSLASVDMLRFDLERFDYVLPETRQRVCDEEMSFVTEGIDRAARTRFVLERKDNDIVYFNEGNWRPYTETLITGLRVAQMEAAEDPRRGFLRDKAVDDLRHGYELRGLQPGQSKTWYSAFPHDAAKRYGNKFITDCGFKPDREMGFLYHATCQADGSIVLESQTVDRSDDQGFAAVMAASQYDPEFNMDTAVRTYDGTLVKKYGGEFYAGRRHTEIGENIWNTIMKQRDLIDFYLEALIQLAASNMPRHELQKQTEQTVIGFWAALKDRISGRVLAYDDYVVYGGQLTQSAYLLMQTNVAYNGAKARGDTLTSCGGSLKPGQDPLKDGDASLEDVFNNIFGINSSEERYKFDKKMYCVVCQAPPKKKAEKQLMCGPCGICKGCDFKMKKSQPQTRSEDYALAA